jgi:hypothetical protein
VVAPGTLAPQPAPAPESTQGVGKFIAEVYLNIRQGKVMRATLGRANLGFLAAFTLTASGCLTIRPYDPGPGKRVVASVIQDTYLSGESINVSISNLSDVTLFYRDGFCKPELQRRDGLAWKTVSEHSAACTSAPGFLDPGQTVVHQYRLPTGVAVGTYRLAMPMPAPEEEDAAPQPQLQTPVFKVQASEQ